MKFLTKLLAVLLLAASLCACNNNPQTGTEQSAVLKESFAAISIAAEGDGWALTEHGVLTVKGNLSACPWEQHKVAIKTVVIEEGVTQICADAFKGCGGLSAVTLPCTLSRIETGAFAFCPALKTVDLPNGLSYIGEKAFTDCGITEISIPGGVAYINKESFLSCTKLKTVTVAEGVTEIKDCAFDSCPDLETVHLPASLIKISADAFAGCAALKAIHFGGTLNQWKSLSLGLEGVSVECSDGVVNA